MLSTAIRIAFLAMLAVTPLLAGGSTRPEDRRADLAAIFHRLEDIREHLATKGIDLDGLAAEALERAGATEDEEGYARLLDWLARQLRDSHADVLPGDSHHLAFLAARKRPTSTAALRLRVGVDLMPGADGTVIATVVASSALIEKGVRRGALLAEIDGRQAREVFEERAAALYADGGFSTPQAALVRAFREGVRFPEEGAVNLVFRVYSVSYHKLKAALDEKDRLRAYFEIPDAWKTVEVEVRREKAVLVPRTAPFDWGPVKPVHLRRAGSIAYQKLASGFGYLRPRAPLRGLLTGAFLVACEDMGEPSGLILDLRGLDLEHGEPALSHPFSRSRLKELPLAVLVDRATGRAMEKAAAKLREGEQVRLFGTPTMGSTGRPDQLTLPSGFATLRYTTTFPAVDAPLARPEFDGVGLTPDFPVEQSFLRLLIGQSDVLRAAEMWLTDEIR